MNYESAKAQQEIKSARFDGYDAGVSYCKEFGTNDAIVYVNQLCDENKKPSNQMYGYISGFMNAIKV